MTDTISHAEFHDRNHRNFDALGHLVMGSYLKENAQQLQLAARGLACWRERAENWGPTEWGYAELARLQKDHCLTYKRHERRWFLGDEPMHCGMGLELRLPLGWLRVRFEVEHPRGFEHTRPVLYLWTTASSLPMYVGRERDDDVLTGAWLRHLQEAR